MIEFLAEKITEYFLAKNIILSENKAIYKYGAEITISSLVGYILILMIGIVTHSFLNSIIFLLCFSSIRIFSGGYHADTYLKCNAKFVLLYFAIIGAEKIFPIKIAMYVGVLMVITSVLIMLILSPIENKNKPLTLEEKKEYRKKSIFLLIFWVLIGLVLLALDIKIWLIIFLTVFSIAISMVAEKIIKNKRKVR